MKIQKDTILGASSEHQFYYNGELNILANPGIWPVAIWIQEDRIDVSVWAVAPDNAPLRIREGSGLGWRFREESSSPTDPGAYEFVGVENYRREGWIRFHQMRECSAISLRRDYKFKGGKMNLSDWFMDRWEEGRGINNGFHGPFSREDIRGDMRQRIQAYTWLMERVDELLAPDSDIRRHAEAMRLQNDARHRRLFYEEKIKEANRTLVIDDCREEIFRATTELNGSVLHSIKYTAEAITKKQRTALEAAIYGLAMGEDYIDGLGIDQMSVHESDEWTHKVRGGLRFTATEVERFYPQATEFNSLQFSNGVLVNMWNALAKHPQRAEIADYAKLVWGAIEDMKATHDKSEARCFMWKIEDEAHTENDTRQKEVR